MASKKPAPKPEREFSAPTEYLNYEGYDAEGRIVRVVRVAVGQYGRPTGERVRDTFAQFPEVESFKFVGRSED